MQETRCRECRDQQYQCYDCEEADYLAWGDMQVAKTLTRRDPFIRRSRDA